MGGDTGARNLVLLLAAVAGCVMIFYGYLAWHALALDSTFVRFIETKKTQAGAHVASQFQDKPRPFTPANVDRGRRVYLSVGCALCHGVDGAGQVKNPNYVKETMPVLNLIAERMFLVEAEDSDSVIQALQAGMPLDAQNLEVPRAAAVVAQYESIRQVIMSGNPGGKKDAAGNAPFDMPKWDDRLTQSDVNDVIAYLLSLYPWDKSEAQ